MTTPDPREHDQGPAPLKAEIDHQRYEILRQLEDWMETPMLVLAFVWLALLVMEFIWGLSESLQGPRHGDLVGVRLRPRAEAVPGAAQA